MLAAALLLCAQLAAVAHYHPSDHSEGINAQAQVVPDGGLCALCILAFHLPLNPAAQPALERPQIEMQPAEPAAPQTRIFRPLLASLTRAPPPAA
ncbi:MAG: hypothetical protein ACREQN_04110 [Candidatus Binataceae bacterium]